MSEVTYEQIQPLIASSNQQGASMQVVFRCPVLAKDFPASAALRKENTVGNKVASSAKRRAAWSLKSSLGRAVRQACGYGIAGSLAADAAYSATDGVMKGGGQQSFSEDDQRRAIVDAFEGIRASFAWSASENRFISAEAAGAIQPDLLNQLAAAPVVAPYDRGIFARMLAQVAASDGQFGDDERAFFGYFITPDMGTIDSLGQHPPLSAAELAEVAGPARETMLMLAWSLALADKSIDQGEYAQLTHFANNLSIAPMRAEELKGYAQLYVIDQSLGPVYQSGQRDPAAYQQVVALGQYMGLDPSAVERTDIRFRKRHGIV